MKCSSTWLSVGMEDWPCSATDLWACSKNSVSVRSLALSSTTQRCVSACCRCLTDSLVELTVKLQRFFLELEQGRAGFQRVRSTFGQIEEGMQHPYRSTRIANLSSCSTRESDSFKTVTDGLLDPPYPLTLPSPTGLFIFLLSSVVQRSPGGEEQEDGLDRLRHESQKVLVQGEEILERQWT